MLFGVKIRVILFRFYRFPLPFKGFRRLGKSAKAFIVSLSIINNAISASLPYLRLFNSSVFSSTLLFDKGYSTKNTNATAV